MKQSFGSLSSEALFTNFSASMCSFTCWVELQLGHYCTPARVNFEGDRESSHSEVMHATNPAATGILSTAWHSDLKQLFDQLLLNIIRNDMK